MCLTASKLEHPDFIPLVAPTDITCWKVIRWSHPSFIQKSRGGISIPTGVYFASYIYGKDNKVEHFGVRDGVNARVYESIYGGARRMEVNTGLHAFKNFSDAVKELDCFSGYGYNPHDESITYEIMECTIPKGTRFFYGFSTGGYECYAAETLIINDINDNNFPQGHFMTEEENKNFYHVPDFTIQ